MTLLLHLSCKEIGKTDSWNPLSSSFLLPLLLQGLGGPNAEGVRNQASEVPGVPQTDSVTPQSSPSSSSLCRGGEGAPRRDWFGPRGAGFGGPWRPKNGRREKWRPRKAISGEPREADRTGPLSSQGGCFSRGGQGDETYTYPLPLARPILRPGSVYMRAWPRQEGQG